MRNVSDKVVEKIKTYTFYVKRALILRYMYTDCLVDSKKLKICLNIFRYKI